MIDSVEYIETPAGRVPAVSTGLDFSDISGSWKARWGIGRMSYTVSPGLYAVGSPGPGSHVLVTSNYRMTFDTLRSNLSGFDLWILVLDTKGINVWCAAGKGTFSNEEICRQVLRTGLEKVVGHRKLIVPQLGAPGVKAFELEKRCGFRVIYGPVRAVDIPEFLRAGLKARDGMREVTFHGWERAILVPVEITTSLKYFLPLIGLVILLSGLSPEGFTSWQMGREGLLSTALLSAGYLGGALLTPLMLPLLPGRAFSMKGAIVGLFLAIIGGIIFFGHPAPFVNRFSAAGWCLIIPAVSSFMAMNFTGSSTFTSLSGVRIEIRRFLPLQVAFLLLGTLLWIGGRYL